MLLTRRPGEGRRGYVILRGGYQARPSRPYRAFCGRASSGDVEPLGDLVIGRGAPERERIRSASMAAAADFTVSSMAGIAERELLAASEPSIVLGMCPRPDRPDGVGGMNSSRPAHRGSMPEPSTARRSAEVVRVSRACREDDCGNRHSRLAHVAGPRSDQHVHRVGADRRDALASRQRSSQELARQSGITERSRSGGPMIGTR